MAGPTVAGPAAVVVVACAAVEFAAFAVVVVAAVGFAGTVGAWAASRVCFVRT